MAIQDLNVWRNPVFLASSVFVFILAVIGVVMPNSFGLAANLLYEITTVDFGWFYLMTVFLIVVFLVGLAISKYGSIRLAEEGEKPEYSFFTWIGMLFSAGFGVGLVFWGVAEPMSHFFAPPFENVEPQTDTAARLAMGYAFFHWGISQWAVFALVGLVIGFLQFRKKKSELVSPALEPELGKKSFVTHTVDSLAVIATVMGIATSLGLGVLQMSGGLHAVFQVGHSAGFQWLIVVLVFAAYMISTMTGLDKGIRYLSNFNLLFALGLLVFVFIAGPTVFILESFTLALGDYLSNFIQYSLRMQPYAGGTWVRDWTIFYWAWTIAWSPYVGAFVARVSKGRTIREYLLGVMAVPPLIACIWIAVFGGTAVWHDLNRGAGIAAAVDQDVTSALFHTFEQLPFSMLLSVISIFLILTFLVTSADSATYILASMSAKGRLTPPLIGKIVWGVLMAAIAAALLYSGGLDALQTASLVSALPFTAILLLMLLALAKVLRKEPLPIRKADVRRFKRLREATESEQRK